MVLKLKKSNRIIVIASFAIDYITDSTGVLHKRKGGPAYWICQALKRIRMPFLIITGRRPALVDIRLDLHGEHGDFRRVDLIRLRAQRTAKAFIVSTIGNEFPIEQFSLLHGIIVVDLQGYVRNARASGTFVNIPISISRRIGIAQVPASELSYIEPALIASQKQRILIITHGATGFELFYQKKRYNFPTIRRIVSPDTIGAGDTLLTAFVVEWLKTRDISKAGRKAQNIVESFLRRKIRVRV